MDTRSKGRMSKSLPKLTLELLPKFEKAVAKFLDLLFDDKDPVWSDAPRVLITGGIRVGKSTRGAFRALRAIFRPNTRLIWLVGPTYKHTHEEFRMLLEWCTKLNLVQGRPSLPQDGIRSMTLKTGCRIETRSADHPERLASVAPDLIILCEPGQMSAEIYDIVLGRLVERRGTLYMVGTLEDDQRVQRWAWYENLATEWASHPDGHYERSYELPTWTNKKIFPLGFQDPWIQERREAMSEYRFERMFAGKPTGVENPVFALLHESGVKDEIYTPCLATNFVDGAIGVDYGRTWDHPSAIVVVHVDDIGRYWIREAWEGRKVDKTEIESMVKLFQEEYKIWQGCVDPNQAILADTLGFTIAAGGQAHGKPSDMRFSLVNGVLENRQLYFDSTGQSTIDVYESMKLCRKVVNLKGELVYNRPIGDDLAQALCYAIECLRGNYQEIPILNYGETTFRYDHSEPTTRGVI